MNNPLDGIPVSNEQNTPKFFPPGHFDNASWEKILEETDWDLLREQKETLYNIIRDNPVSILLSVKQREHIEGVLNLLDNLQEATANELGDEKVFNQCAECGNQLKIIMKDMDGTNLEEVKACPECDEE